VPSFSGFSEVPHILRASLLARPAGMAFLKRSSQNIENPGFVLTSARGDFFPHPAGAIRKRTARNITGKTKGFTLSNIN
jgi:hypothetical protein